MHAMDVDMAEALAGVVGLLRQAALRAWAATDRAGTRFPGQTLRFRCRPGRRPGPALVAGRHWHRRTGASRWRTRRPAEVGGAGVGGLMASLDSYPLDLVVAVLRHAGSGGSTRSSSDDSAGLVVMTDGRSRSISMPHSDRDSAPRPAPTVPAGETPPTFPAGPWRVVG
jgi:hypothetical protein